MHNNMHNNMPNHDLIQLHLRTIGDAPVPTVSARQLHSFLEVGKDFSTWIKDRIGSLGFSEGQDYVIAENLISPDSGKSTAGRQLKEYYLTIDMAKELSMVERNAKGKQARRYFIECEKRLMAAPPAAPMTREQQIAQALLLSQEIIAEKDVVIGQQQAQIAQQGERLAVTQPKAQAFDRIAREDGGMTRQEAAKALKVRPHWLITFLREINWTFKKGEGRKEKEQAYQDKIDQGLLYNNMTSYTRKNGTVGQGLTVMITGKGLAKLALLINQRDRDHIDAVRQAEELRQAGRLL